MENIIKVQLPIIIPKRRAFEMAMTGDAPGALAEYIKEGAEGDFYPHKKDFLVIKNMEIHPKEKDDDVTTITMNVCWVDQEEKNKMAGTSL